MDQILFYILFASSILCFAGIIIYGAMKIYNQKKYGRLSSVVFWEKYSKKLQDVFAKSKSIVKINDEIAYKISVFNSMSFEKNKGIAAFVILGFILFAAALSILLITLFWPYWYIALVYIIFINTAVLFAMQLISETIMNRYLKKLPEAIKILQSRFMSKESISKAIHVSIPDLPSGIKGEMTRIYNAMKQNEIEKTKKVFYEVDKKYSNEHMSVLLDLIWLAYYNGGTETIKSQFDAMVSDILEDLENQQDLTGAAISYVAMSVLFLLAVPLVQMYNGSILSEHEMQYYSTRGGMLFAAAYVGFLILLIGLLFYLKKKG